MLVGLHDVDPALGVHIRQGGSGPCKRWQALCRHRRRCEVTMATSSESASVVVPAPARLQDAVATVVMNAALPPARRFDASCQLLPNRVGRIASRPKCPHAAEWTRRSSLSKRRRNARNCPRMLAPLVAGRRGGHLLHPAGVRGTVAGCGCQAKRFARVHPAHHRLEEVQR